MTTRSALALAAALSLFPLGHALAQQPGSTVPTQGAPALEPNPQLLYLQENAKKPGWRTTASGLQYKVVKAVEGNAPRPAPTDTVTVHYRGTLIDGKEFDSSYARNEPVTFGLTRLIPAWREGIPMMKVGEVWDFVVPASLGYGQRGAGNGEIPGGATLLFTVELLGIKTPDTTNLLAPPGAR